MAADASTSVSVIDGIGPQIAAGLARIGVHVVFDLLRGTTEQLRVASQPNASLADVESWKSQAVLLQVAAVTPPWAAALVGAGVLSVDALAAKKPSAIAGIMAAAQVEGRVAKLPTSDEIGEMLTDAAVLTYTGCITGTVFDTKRKPVSNVTVRLGTLEAKTDVRGRFRLLRIRLGTILPLRFEHPKYRTHTLESPLVSLDVAAVGGQKFRLRRGRNPKKRILSELNGDVVPVGPGQPIRQSMVPVATLRRGDILTLREFYKNKSDAQLLCRFKTMEDGVVFVRTVRVPLSRIPANPPPQVGEYFRFTGTKFLRITMRPADFDLEKTVRRMRKEFARRARPKTRKERVALIDEKLDYLMEHAFFIEEKHL